MSETIPGTLDWQSMPLHGRVLIEASAGTGKTFTIGLVFLRLLLERGLRVEQILVATFTDRAAQELRERLRARLIEAEHILRHASTANSADDASLHTWFDSFRADDVSLKQALRRVQLARADLDRAPIGTIHSICQRILREHPLETGATLLPEKLTDQNALLRECVEDFWRRRYLVGAVDAAESDAVVERGIESLIADLRGLIDVDAKILPLDDPSELERGVETLRNADHAVTLRALSANKVLYGKSKRALSTRFVEFAEVIEANGDILAMLTDRSADYLDPPKFHEQLSDAGKQILVEHSLVVLLRRVRLTASAQKRSIRARVLSAALAFCREEIPRRARLRNVQTYSMLIDTVHARLCVDANHVFADTLFETYPAALIDEFQDTDNRQFEILDRIYRNRGLLVMIGDPKQSIYAFRGGDIAAYLRARRSAQAQFALTVNQRSSTELVCAMNSLYANIDGGFSDADIRYRNAKSSGKADATAYRIGPEVVQRPLSIHRFLRDIDAGANAGEVDERAFDDCAARIVELLNDPRHTIGGSRIVPGDVAVLVTKNDQIASLRRRLVARGVPCVGTGRGNIFDSDIARDLELVLHAVLNSGDDRAVRGALCTRLLGATLNDVRRWQRDEQAFELELERFSAWHALARSRGVQALIQTLVASRASELLALADGDRIVTDLRHIGELLVDDGDASQGLESAYNRLVALRREEGESDADTEKNRRLRIETDSARVQLMTIHAAKGLQFPIVFLPFVWRIGDRTGSHKPKVLRFHDDEGTPWIDLGSRDFDTHLARHFDEDLQERLRLLYVALTRAKYAVHVYWSDRNGAPASGADACKTAAIDVLINQTQRALGLTAGETSLGALAAHCEGVHIVEPFAGPFARYQTSEPPPSERRVREPLPSPRPFVWLHSFSSLTRQAPLALAESAASDEIETEVDIEMEQAVDDRIVADDPALMVLDAWRGRHFGNALHAILENAASGPMWPTQRPLLARHLSPLGVKHVGAGDALEPVGRMVDRIRGTDLGDGLRLADLPLQAVISEFEFQFPVNGISLAALRDICVAHGIGDAVSESMTSAALDGMMTGFADLIFVHDGKFHVLDYKTNWLGTRLEDYAGPALDTAMREHHYALQALIYTIALHRYLRGRLDGYTPERHLGDSWYLFVRAIGLGDNLGVWRRRWPADLVTALDDAFAQRKAAA